jgi:tryptophan-rich sensory protein
MTLTASTTDEHHGSGQQILAAAIFAGTTLAVAAVGSIATGGGQAWYDTLDKPSFTPPDATFGIVWTILYVLIAVAGWIAWRATDDPRPTIAWAVQMALNLLWTAVFFGLEAPWPAVGVIVALIGALIATIAVFRQVAPVAAVLMVPYLLWVLFAAALNIGVAVLN